METVSKSLFIIITFLAFTYSIRAQKTWTGIGGNGLWTTASNWSGNSVPTASDDITLDNTNVSGSYTVTIPANSAAVCGTIKIGYPGNTNTITLLFESKFVRGGGGNPAGLVFGNGGGSDIDFLIDNGGVFINASTATSGTNYIESAGLTDLVQVNSGGKFEQVTTESFKNPFPSTNITFKSGSTMEWNVRGSLAVSPDVSSYTFGNLVFASDSAGGTRTYSSPGGGGGTFIILNTWTIKSGVTLSPWGLDGIINNIDFSGSMSFGTAGVNVSISGNITTDAQFTTSNSLNSSLTLNGNSVQTISGTVPLTFNGATVFNNPFGFVLNNEVVVNSTLNLSNGKINTSDSGILTIGASGSITGANFVNYVNGPMQRIIASTAPTNISFPIGKGSAYRPIALTITQNSATPTAYKGEMFNSAPAERNLPSTLDLVSFVRHFKVTKGSGAGVTSVSITINYDTMHVDDGVRNSANLRVAKDDGVGNWIDLGGDASSANFVGSITSSIPFTSFSDFVLANNNGGANKLGGLPPTSPTLLSVSNNAGNVAINPELVWTKPVNASTFHLQLAEDSQFNSIVFDDSTLTDTVKTVGLLNNKTKYFWRVRAKNIIGTSPYSNSFSFTTIVAKPSTPTLSSPLNGAINQPVDIVLTWNTAIDASTYQVQVSTDSTFSTFVFNDSTISDTVKSVNALSNDIKYFWRVRSINAAGKSAISQIRNFTTIVASPSTANLISPLNNSKGQDTTVNLVWNKVKETDRYIVQLAIDSTFSSFIMNDLTVADTIKQISGLSGNTVYYWRVASVNISGISPFASVWNFTTKLITRVKGVRSGIPESYQLYQNYPNPFNPSTTISYDLPVESKVVLSVFNIIGQVVKELKNETEAPGTHKIFFNAGDLASGFYIYRISAKSTDGKNELNAVRKFVLLK